MKSTCKHFAIALRFDREARLKFDLWDHQAGTGPCSASSFTTSGCDSSLPIFSYPSRRLFFGYSDDVVDCDSPVGADAPRPSKAHVQAWKHGDTTVAQVLRRERESAGYRIPQAEPTSENHLTKDQGTIHSSVTQRACPLLRALGGKWKAGVTNCVYLKLPDFRAGKVRCPCPLSSTVRQGGSATSQASTMSVSKLAKANQNQSMTIYKYPLIIVSKQTLLLPLNARILTVQAQRDTVCLWALIHYEGDTPESRTIEIFGTGEPMDEAHREYVDTAQVGLNIWHVFERL